ncbi:MAG TPA: TraR/DksA C4-type zinc finger protein [Burkholderiaceae bacterium]|nr:TraR/DksA C4-type zinc finger protein [Burkholderiaceae bacterium]
MSPLSETDLQSLAVALKQRRAQVGIEVRDRLHRDGLVIHEDAALPNRREETDDDAAADTATRMDIAAVARDAEELAKLEGALKRLSEGEYGVCTECGDAIARERLFANPAATRCAECQQFAERTARVARATRG